MGRARRRRPRLVPPAGRRVGRDVLAAGRRDARRGARQLLPPGLRPPARGIARARSSRCTARARPSSRSSATSRGGGTRATSTCRTASTCSTSGAAPTAGPLALGGPLLEVDTTPARRHRRDRRLGPCQRRATDGFGVRSRATARFDAKTVRSVRVAAGEEVERVGDDGQDHLDGLRSRRSRSRAGCRPAPAPRAPATARDSMPKPRPPSSLTRRIASTKPGASRSMTARVPSGREVARAEAGAARRDDEAGEAVGRARATLRPRSRHRRRRRGGRRRRNPAAVERGARARHRSCRRAVPATTPSETVSTLRLQSLTGSAPATRRSARVADRTRPPRADRRHRRCRCRTRGCRRPLPRRGARCRS